jgi:hypothetical protein
MVLPVKVFEITDEIDFTVLVQKLKNFHEEETYESESGGAVNLVTEILDLDYKDRVISGIFSKDFIYTRFYQRELIETPITEEALFWIESYNERTFLIVSAPSVARGVKKLLTGNVANKFSRILFIRIGAIIEVDIPHETLRDLHESNPQGTRLIWFDQIDIPGVDKLCLAGSDVADTQLYQDYLKHGKIWYVVFESQKSNIVLGITRSCVVTLFSKSSITDFLRYVREDILKLIQ